MSDLQDLYEEKYADYYLDPREDLVRLVNGTSLTVLEIGCGAGATGKRLLETGKAKWVTGVELVPSQAELARCVLNEVLVADIGQLEIPWQTRSFDCIIAGDVLEHLGDPWSVLGKLKPLLCDDGMLIVSIPNVRHWWVIRDLVLRGEWRYQKDGVLDKTHLRFFTRRSAQRMLQDSGYGVVSVRPYFWGPRTRIFNRFTVGVFEEFLAQRWLMRAHPVTLEEKVNGWDAMA